MLLDRLKATGCIFALFLGVFAVAAAAQAGPEDGRIVNGSGSISQSGTHTDIRQNSDFLATHWGSFNIAAHESVQAHQPGASSRLLIRVDGGGATNIAGNYTSNGITILENRNGVQFSRGAIVNVGGLLATSSRISGVAGANWQLDGTGGAVVNHGQIAAGAGGAILAAVKVQNTGDITAKGGDVALGAGSSFTVDFAGSMVGFEVRQAASGASIVNTGKIESQGGVVAFSAREAQAVRTNVVSVGGVVKATKMERRGGVVYLSGGDEGIAEVSGDVQASEKVQTTGEYVVVKEGAVLKAPEILVGGDFQGKGDVQTAKRTLVERGALLDAGAGGRVIVWSEETTWFNGDIAARGGFAEVSGKQTLASVHLAGIDVGEFGELLLDPADIIIAAMGDPVPVGGILDADPSGGTMTLGVDSINGFTGNLTLAASNTIMVNVAILKPTGNLTLTAGGILTISANITTSAGDLTLTGTDIIGRSFLDIDTPGFVLGGDVVLTGGAINLTGTIMRTGSANLTIRATGALTLNSHINTGTGNLTLDSDIAINLTSPWTILTGGAITLRGAITEATTQRFSRFSVIASGRLTLNNNITAWQVFLTGTGGITLGSDIMLRGRMSSVIGPSVVLTGEITEASSGNHNLILQVGNAGYIGINGNINLGSGNLTFLINVLRSRNIRFSGTTTLAANNITITGPIDESGTGGNNALTVMASGVLTLNDDINTGTGALTLSGASIVLPGAFTTRIILGGAITLTGRVVDVSVGLTVRATGVLTLNDNINTGTRVLTLSGVTIALGGSGTRTLTGAGIILTGAITRTGSAALTVRATAGVITLNGNIDIGTGALFLTGVRIDLGSDLTSLTGGAVSLTGAINHPIRVNKDLTITASGRLTLNSGINLGVGTLTINAGERINVANPNTVITAGAFAINFADQPAVQNPAEGFTIGDTATLGNLAASSTTPTFTFANSAPVAPVVDCVTGDGACMLGTGVTINLLTDDADLASSVSITISIGSGTLTFGGGLAPITIEAPTVSITAGNIDIGGRALTITASGGALTLNTRITASAGSTGAVELTATGGALTIGGNINALGGNIILRGMDVVTAGSLTVPGIQLGSEIGQSRNITLTGAAITLTGTIDEGVSGNNANDILTVRATGVLTLNDNIRAHSLRLSSMRIVLGSDINLLAGRVTLTGMIDESGAGGNDSLTVGRGFVTFNSDINLGTGTLTFGGRTIVATGTPTLTAGRVSLSQAGTFADNLFTIADSVISLGLDAGSANQTVHAWMVAGTNRALSITTTGVLTIGRDINTGTGDLTLSGTSIVLSAPVELMGAAINLTGAIDESAGTADANGKGGNDNLTITATGDITINDDINLGPDGELTLFAGMGGDSSNRRNILSDPDNTETLTAGTVSLRQDDAFGDTFAGPTGTFRISTSTLNLSASDSQPVRNWMVVLNRSLSITSGVRVEVGEDIVLGTGDLTLRGRLIGINGARTLSGGAITLTGAVYGASNSGRDLTIRASGDITINSDIDIGTGNLSLWSGVGNIVATSTPTLTASAVSLRQSGAFAETARFMFAASVGRLQLKAVAAQTVYGWMVVSDRSLFLFARGITVSGNVDIGSGDLTFWTNFGNIMAVGTPTLTAGTVSLTQDAAFGSPALFTFGADTSSLELTTTANQDVLNWMIEPDRNLTVTSSNRVRVMGAIGMDESDRNIGGGDLTLTSTGGAVRILGGISTTGDVTITASGTLTIDSDINIGANALTLTSGAGAIVATGRPRLTAGMVSFSQVDALPVTRPFRFIPGASLAITTEAAQDVHDWMIRENIDLTVTSSNRVRVVAIIGTGGVAGRNLGTGTLSLTSTGGAVRILDNITTGGNITLSGGAGGINLNGTDTLTGAAITLTGDARGNRDLTLDASGTLRINSNITLTGAGNLDLSSDTVVRILANITTGGNITLSGGTGGINFNNGAAAKTLSGAAITLTGDARSNRDLTINASGVLTLNGGINTGTSALSLSGSSVALGGALTLTGGDITLTGAATGTADLTLTASGILTLNNDIAIGANALTLTSGAGAIVATGRPRLTAGMVSFSQVDALPVTRPFRFIPGSSLAITTEAAQDVHDWMILENINLTVTSSNRVRVVAIIGTGGVAGRNLGTGALSLTSTGGAVRILANISISNNITLSGVTGGINLNGTATLTGAAITLTGDARGNRDLTITATGVLTINNNINIGTSTLSLTGASLTFGANVDLTAGDHIFDPTRTCDGSTADPTCTDTTP